MDKHQEEDKKPIHTRAGTSDADVSTGEPISGRAGERNQEEASDFYEELGAIIEGKEEGEVHHPTLEEDEES